MRPLTTLRNALFALLLAAAVLPRPAAAQEACPEHFAGGQPPLVVDQRLLRQARPLCFAAFAVLHSGLTRGPLWSAERVTPEALAGALSIPRRGAFQPEPRLPSGERSELGDYARSGWDRGHMAPSGDMPDEAAQQESFSLANVVPQAGGLNRNLWEAIERAVRDQVQRRGELYVVTGPAFRGSDVQALRGRVLVPTHVWKAVLDPRTGRAAAYWVENTNEATWRAVSVDELRRLTGLDVFPAMPEAARAEVMPLPEPRLRRPRGEDRGRGGGAGEGDGRGDDRGSRRAILQ